MHRLRGRLDFLFKNALADFSAESPAFELANLRGSARHFLLWHLFIPRHMRSIVVVCESDRDAERARVFALNAYRLYTGRIEREEGFLLYPDNEPVNLYDCGERDPESEGQKRAVEEALLFGRANVIFTSLRALYRKLPDPGRARDARILLSSGGGTEPAGAVGEIAIEALVLSLEKFGYRRASIVTAPGEYTIRGGLIDVFPVGAPSPARLDFLGNSIDEISLFDPATQRSFDKAGEVLILPARTAALADAESVAGAIKSKLHKYLAEYEARIPSSAAKLKEIAEEDMSRVLSGRDVTRWEIYAPLCDGGCTLMDYLPKGSVIVCHDEALLESELRTYERFWSERFSEWRKGALSFTELSDYYAFPAARASAALRAHPKVTGGEASILFASTFDRAFPAIAGYDLKLMTPSSAQYSLGALADSLKKTGGGINEVWIASQFAERLRERLAEDEIAPAAVEHSILPGGFAFPDQGMLLTDAEIFGGIEETVYRKPKKYEKSGLRSVDEIKIGDYVVHVDYGVGRFAALSDQEAGGIKRSYVEVEYEGKDKLYVPVDQLDRLRLYRYDGTPPKLNNLGRRSWQKTKRKIKEDAIRLALKLYKLYRKRAQIPGHQFADVEGWLAEFCAGFPYEMTADQSESWDAVLHDMSTAKPMDRLICGDVGFGKTEIALRASFLACMSGKQVLLLCPTTILADQHFHTFRRRFAAFPFRVELLSRFLSVPEQKAVVDAARAGRVDVLIGTHRALSRDVVYKDLGLLIIDEEQRFGVKQKENLKMKHPGVDVLTLTATPIPRTLHMSLVGLRDVSLIETAPVERKPVRTYVGEYDDALVRDSVMRELGRGGQIYFLHNRIEDIEVFKEKLEKLVPEAKIVAAHGQMKEDRLEEIMNAFSLGAFNVLLSTTIIENGLDIPNVNTLLVERAEYLGLAQMHQLRGRVGRSHVQAYSYFFHHPMLGLTPDAEGRLHAIYNYAYLGAGYEIAQSDLRLRGAGNVFGEEQSGLAAAVGFDYYFEMITNSFEAVKDSLEGEEEFDEELFLDSLDEEQAGCVIDVPISAYIPTDYIDDPVLRLDSLRRIARLKENGVDDFRLELLDRFGAPPEPVENLLLVVTIKNIAESIGIASIEHHKFKKAFVFKFA